MSSNPSKRARVEGDAGCGEGPSQPAAAVPRATRDELLDLIYDEADLNCAICLELLKDPRSLVCCGQSLCFACSEKPELYAGSVFNCPMCCVQTDRAGPKGQRQAFPQNRHLATMLEVMRRSGVDARRAKCGECGEREAEVTCGPCGHHFCRACSDKIHAPRTLSSHTRLKYRPGVPPAGPRFLCPTHRGETLFFCEETRVAACVQCIKPADHAEHKHVSIVEGAAALRAELVANLAKREGDLALSNYTVRQQETMIAKIQQAEKAASAAASAHAKKLVSVIDEQHKGWIEGIRSLAAEQRGIILKRSAKAAAAGERLQAALESGRALAEADALQLVRLQPGTVARLESARVLSNETLGPLPLTSITFDTSTAARVVTDELVPIVSRSEVIVELPWEPQKWEGAGDEPEICSGNIFSFAGLDWELVLFPKGAENDETRVWAGLLLRTSGLELQLPPECVLRVQGAIKISKDMHMIEFKSAWNAEELEKRLFTCLIRLPLSRKEFEDKCVKNRKATVTVRFLSAEVVEEDQPE